MIFLTIHILYCLLLMTSWSIVSNLTTSLFPLSCSWIVKSNPSGSSPDKSWHAFLSAERDTESDGEGTVHLGNTSSCFLLRAGHEWFTHPSTASSYASTCTRCAQMRCCYSRSTGKWAVMIHKTFLYLIFYFHIFIVFKKFLCTSDHYYDGPRTTDSRLFFDSYHLIIWWRFCLM
jgi:hypothetical protein